MTSTGILYASDFDLIVHVLRLLRLLPPGHSFPFINYITMSGSPPGLEHSPLDSTDKADLEMALEKHRLGMRILETKARPIPRYVLRRISWMQIPTVCGSVGKK